AVSWGTNCGLEPGPKEPPPWGHNKKYRAKKRMGGGPHPPQGGARQSGHKRAHHGANRSRPSLVGTDRPPQLAAADGAADRITHDVGDPNDREQKHDRRKTVGLAGTQPPKPDGRHQGDRRSGPASHQ